LAPYNLTALFIKRQLHGPNRPNVRTVIADMRRAEPGNDVTTAI
jgi:hypothetical protein